MKNNKGITLIALIITIIVMTIIIGISVGGGSDVLQKSKMTDYIGYMKLVKARADVVLEEDWFEGNALTGVPLSGTEIYYTQISNVINSKGYNNSSKYEIKKWGRNTIASQGIDKTILDEGNNSDPNDDEFFVVIFDKEKVETVDVLYSSGCAIESQRYYSLNDCELAVNGKNIIHVANLSKDSGFDEIGIVSYPDGVKTVDKEGWVVDSLNSILDTNIKKSGNHSLKLIGNSTPGSERICEYVYPYRFDENDIYYINVFLRNTSGIQNNNFAFYYQYGEPHINLSRTNIEENGWVKYSYRFSIGTYNVVEYIRLDNDNLQGNQTVWFDELYIVNLTETFGAGKEPDKAWCDANLEYGVTEVAVPTN